jgi:Mn2+/Fe2+ NRAMP family transporter
MGLVPFRFEHFSRSVLMLLAYVVSMFLAHPDLHQITGAIIHPQIKFDRKSLSILVAMIADCTTWFRSCVNST